MKNKDIIKHSRILQSKRLILRPFTMDDVDDVYAYAKDKELVKYLTWQPHKDIIDSKTILNEFYMNKKGIYAIELKELNKCIGCIDLRIDEKNNKGSFGYVLNREHWNKGYMTEALTSLLNFAFNVKGLNRIESTHYLGNESSGHVMQNCGMKYEGMGVQEIKINDTYHDVLHYAILRKDWK